MTTASKRMRDLRAKNESVAKRFGEVLGAFKRKQKPWLPFDDNTTYGKVTVINKLDDWILDDLIFWHRTNAFDKLMSAVTANDGEPCDAWGPFNLPTFNRFIGRLSKVEQTEFWHYIDDRRRRTLDVEADYTSGRDSLTYSRLSHLLLKAKDDRQRFRFVASVSEFGELYRSTFSTNELALVNNQYEDLYKSVGPGSMLTETPVGNDSSKSEPSTRAGNAVKKFEWFGTGATLITVIDALKAARLFSPTDKQVVAHFEWKRKSAKPLKDPVKRYQGIRDDINRNTQSTDLEELRLLVAELERVTLELKKALPR